MEAVSVLTNKATSAASVAIARREARRSFETWCRYRMSKLGRVPAKHHLLIIKTVEQLLNDELPKRNVMLLMPPGAAKSTYTSVLLPAWFLNPEQYPTELMLACSYSYTLIEGFGKQARDIVEQESSVLGLELSKTSQASGDWRTTLGGGYFCAGVNAGIAGHRARLGLIDDYIGSEEEANSDLIRDKNWKWYWNDFVPRLLPNAWQIIIANRRHEEDLVGRLLEDEADKWHVIRLPMLAEDEHDPLGRSKGERLWPEWFTEEQVRLAKKLPSTWAGLYQQRPSPEEGDYFRKDWIVTYDSSERVPKDLRIYVGSDFAVKKGQDRDYFCFVAAGMDSNGTLWILPDWFWEQTDTLSATTAMLNLSNRRRPICWWSGRENITGSIGPFLYARMRETGIYIPIEELSEARDKEQKAQSIRARMAARQVMFPSFVPDFERVVHELLTFPNGKHDDFVDALGKLGQGLAKMSPASVERPLWDGVVEEQKLTCGWVQRSHRNRFGRCQTILN